MCAQTEDAIYWWQCLWGHRWTKWRPEDSLKKYYPMLDKSEPVALQRRDCLTCGRIQVTRLG